MYQPIYFAKIVHKLTYLLVISWQELSMYYTFRAVLNSKVKLKWIGNKSFFKWRVRNPCLFATAGYCSHLHKSAPSRQANCARDTLFNNGPGQANVDTSFCIYGRLQRPSNAVGSSSIFFGLTSKCFIYQPLTPFFQPSDQHHLFCPFNLEHNKALTKQEGTRRAMHTVSFDWFLSGTRNLKKKH